MFPKIFKNQFKKNRLVTKQQMQYIQVKNQIMNLSKLKNKIFKLVSNNNKQIANSCMKNV